jgi:MFS family permease
MKALVAILRRVLRPLRSGIDTRYPVAANRTSQTYHHAPADLLVFFFASAGAGSAYLTASEVVPLETRALAIAIFYAAGTAIGGVVAPLLFGIYFRSILLGP